MKKNINSFSEFLLIVYPPRSIRLRQDKGILWKVGKWMGIRIAYGLYRAKLTANSLDVLGLIMAGFAFYLLLTAKYGQVVQPLFGIFLIYIHMLIDFIDGSIARGRNESSKIGHELDNFGCIVDRALLLALLGIFSGHNSLLILNGFSACMIFYFAQPSWKFIPNSGFLYYFKRIFLHPLSIYSVRVMLALTLLLLGIIIYFGGPLVEASLYLSLFYFISIVIWLGTCLAVKEVRL
jgi:phosphatidylglycerophosphate synthase